MSYCNRINKRNLPSLSLSIPHTPVEAVIVGEIRVRSPGDLRRLELYRHSEYAVIGLQTVRFNMITLCVCDGQNICHHLLHTFNKRTSHASCPINAA
jgi:hypothetical protein